jgi:hypothetical protein
MFEGFKIKVAIPKHKAVELRGKLEALLKSYDAPHLSGDKKIEASGEIKGYRDPKVTTTITREFENN